MLQIYYNSFDIRKRNVKKVLVPLQPLCSKGYRDGVFEGLIYGRFEGGGCYPLFSGVFKDTIVVWARAAAREGTRAVAVGLRGGCIGGAGAALGLWQRGLWQKA
jgi:hypothetical protein